MSRAGIRVRPGLFSRIISACLLTFILYGTTVEAAHRHGRFLNSSEPNSANSLTGKNTSQTLLNSVVNCGDCLICQLHQDFSAPLEDHRLATKPKAVRTVCAKDLPPLVQSLTLAPLSGRAPPTAN